jgi:Mrp family chromosome partitioning ATPase
MPVLESYVLASNRGGVGKTTALCQLSAAYALAHPEVNVLVVDFSIHGDASSQLLGARAPSCLCALTPGATPLRLSPRRWAPCGEHGAV